MCCDRVADRMLLWIAVGVLALLGTPSVTNGRTPGATPGVVDTILEYSDSLHYWVMQPTQADTWVMHDPKGKQLPDERIFCIEAAERIRSRRAAYWLQPRDSLRSHAKEVIRRFLSDCALVSYVAMGSNYLVHPRVLRTTVMLLGCGDTSASDIACRLLYERTPYELLRLNRAVIRQALAVAPLSRSRKDAFLPYLVDTPEERASVHSMTVPLPSWTLTSQRAAVGDTLALDTLVSYVMRTKNYVDFRIALWRLADVGTPEAANRIVALFGNSCFSNSHDKDTTVKMSYRYEVVCCLERYHPTEPLFADSAHFLVTMDLSRTPNRATTFVDLFRAWAKTSYGTVLPPEVPPLPLEGPCDISRPYAKLTIAR